LSSVGSNGGIANVNIGTSGAEIGGVFCGQKATGGWEVKPAPIAGKPTCADKQRAKIGQVSYYWRKE